MALSAGTKAPEFSLADQDGTIHTLNQYAGQRVILYFYPKDDTPGCTTEACNFRDDFPAYTESGAVILGVSPDKAGAHTKFREKYNLPFTLLSDPDHAVAEAYEAWGRKKYMGREYDGVLRTTYLIDANGVIEKVFENVKVADHSAEVLAALRG